jgi:hypothetical protein
MNGRTALLVVLGLGALCCGNEDANHTGPSASVFGLSVFVEGVDLAPQPGLGSPVSLTLRVVDMAGLGGIVDGGHVRLSDSQGATVAEAQLSRETEIPNRSHAEIAVELVWAPGSGPGRQLEITVNAEDARGGLHELRSTLRF